MIQPANIIFSGVVGGTFDTQITLFEGDVQWVWYGVWQPYRTYPVNATVAGSDSNLYVSINPIVENDNPVNDSTNWQLLTPLNLTGWTGSCTIGSSDSSVTADCILGGTEGTIAVVFSPEQTSGFAAETYSLNIQTVDGSGNTYFPVIGTISFVSP